VAAKGDRQVSRRETRPFADLTKADPQRRAGLLGWASRSGIHCRESTTDPLPRNVRRIAAPLRKSLRTGDRPGQQSLDHQRPTRSDRHPGTPPVDRQIEEALAPGPDPVHLATVSVSTKRPPSATPPQRANSCRPCSNATLRIEPNPRVEPHSQQQPTLGFPTKNLHFR
jgi:hypothetical protein